MIALFKSLPFFLAFGFLSYLFGFLLSQFIGPFWAFIPILICLGALFLFSDKIVLMFLSAREIKMSDYPYLFQITQKGSFVLGTRMPRLYLYEEKGGNILGLSGFFGKKSIVIQKKILETLNSDELQAVLYFHLAGFKNHFIFLRTFFCALDVLIGIPGGLLAKTEMFFLGQKSYPKSGKQRTTSVLALTYSFFVYPVFYIFIKPVHSFSETFKNDSLVLKAGVNYSTYIAALKKMAFLSEVKSITEYFLPGPCVVDYSFKEYFFDMFQFLPKLEQRQKKLLKDVVYF